MKTNLIKFLLLFTCFTFAQTSKINNVNNFLLRNSGAILDKNKDVDGYYFYYIVD
ncbi:DUF6770 family protein, partial [Flavobacterium oreochromis]